MKRHCIRLSNIVLIVVLTALQVSAGLVAPGENSSEARQVGESEWLEKSIPSNVATVTEHYEGPAHGVVYIIEDFHTHPEAQLNTARVLDILVRSGKIRRVGVEGGTGRLEPLHFKAIPDEDVKKRTAEIFLNTGYLNGAEYYGIFAKEDIELVGLEDPQLYARNASQFRQLWKGARGARNILARYDQTAAVLAKRVWPRDTESLVKAVEGYRRGRVKHNVYLETVLESLSKMNVALDPNSQAFQARKVVALARRIQKERLSVEQEKLMNRLKSRMDWTELEELVKMNIQYKAKAIGALEYFTYIREKTEKAGIDLRARYPNFHIFCEKMILQESVNRQALQEELQSLVQTLYRHMNLNADQAELLDIQQTLTVWENLLKLRANRIELRMMERDPERYDPERVRSRLAALAERYKVEFSVPRSEFKTLRSALQSSARAQGGYWGSDEAFLGVLAKNEIHVLDAAIHDARAYYSTVVERDTVLAKNTLNILAGSEDSSAAVFVGGFHSEGIRQALEEKGITHAVLVPRFKSTGILPYERRMLEKTADWKAIYRETAMALALWSYCAKPVTELQRGLLRALSQNIQVASEAQMLEKELPVILTEILKGQLPQMLKSGDITRICSDVAAKISDFRSKMGEYLNQSPNEEIREDIERTLRSFPSEKEDIKQKIRAEIVEGKLRVLVQTGPNEAPTQLVFLSTVSDPLVEGFTTQLETPIEKLDEIKQFETLGKIIKQVETLKLPELKPLLDQYERALNQPVIARPKGPRQSNQLLPLELQIMSRLYSTEREPIKSRNPELAQLLAEYQPAYNLHAIMSILDLAHQAGEIDQIVRADDKAPEKWTRYQALPEGDNDKYALALEFLDEVYNAYDQRNTALAAAAAAGAQSESMQRQLPNNLRSVFQNYAGEKDPSLKARLASLLRPSLRKQAESNPERFGMLPGRSEDLTVLDDALWVFERQHNLQEAGRRMSLGYLELLKFLKKEALQKTQGFVIPISTKIFSASAKGREPLLRILRELSAFNKGSQRAKIAVLWVSEEDEKTALIEARDLSDHVRGLPGFAHLAKEDQEVLQSLCDKTEADRILGDKVTARERIMALVTNPESVAGLDLAGLKQAGTIKAVVLPNSPFGRDVAAPESLRVIIMNLGQSVDTIRGRVIAQIKDYAAKFLSAKDYATLVEAMETGKFDKIFEDITGEELESFTLEADSRLTATML